jgi:hypothetical protein
MSEERTYILPNFLPENGERCLCYGYHTVCCSQDMDDEPSWSEVTFRFSVSYLCKETVPNDPEESILAAYSVQEIWDCGDEFLDGRIIGVTKWKNLPKH